MIRHGLALHVADKDLMGLKLRGIWGFAYRLHDVCYTIFYPIPLNLIVRYALKFYWLIYRWVRYGGWKDRLDDAYWRGYNDGNTAREHHYDVFAKTIIEGLEGKKKEAE